ncbi:MAG: TonB-dependent receptor domain-containing protein [Candidatus Zixiibacteriota bacterium]
MKKLILTLALLPMLLFSETGSLRGNILDNDTGEPLIAANVILQGAQKGAATDLDGNYIVYNIEPGSYVVKVTYVGYQTYTIEDVEISSGETSKLDISLKPDVSTTEAIVVKAKRVNTTTAALVSNQKRAQAITSGISSEQISKSPDSKASDALKRITGLTIKDDKYVFVRGLSERYSNSQLNNSSLPSPEPDKRSVPFDIFPSNILDNAVIHKAFVPNLPGDFAGGSISLQTKEFMQSFQGDFSASFGYNEQTTFQDFKTYDGGKIDFLGFDDGTRAMPEIVKENLGRGKLVESGVFTNGFTSEELEEFGESFDNTWSPHGKTAPINQSYSLSMGNTIDLNEKPFGYIFSATYKNKFSYREEDRAFFVSGADENLEQRHFYEGLNKSSNDIVWGGVLNTSYRFSMSDKISLKTTFTHNTEDEVLNYAIMPNQDHNLNERVTRLRWIERDLISLDLSGDHATKILNNTEVDWQATYARAGRKEPDTREVMYEAQIDEDYWRLADEYNSGSRFFSDLVDHNLDFALDFETPFKNWNEKASKFQYGMRYSYKYRDIQNRRFRYIPKSFCDVDITASPEEIFTQENIGSANGFAFEENTRPTDNYEASQHLTAGYVMVDMPLLKKLRFVGGVRGENSDQIVETFDPFLPNPQIVEGRVNNLDFMPAASFTYKLSDDMNIRASVSQTVSRPSFRELSEFEFTDIGGHAVIGNAELKRTTIQNYDFRWEFYPGIAENIAIAVLYKNFQNPIEVSIVNATEKTLSWRNAESAKNYGFEFEIRKALGFINPYLAPFSVTGNFTLIQSKIELDGSGPETTQERELQGQSPYVVNAMLGYSDPNTYTEATMSYNIQGRRIEEVGSFSVPDVYEEESAKLDFVVSQPLSKKIKAKFSASNLLDPYREYTQGDETVSRYKTGRSYSLGLSYSF